MRRSFLGPPFFLQRPAQGVVGVRSLRLQLQHLLPARDRLGRLFARLVQLGQVLPERGLVRRQRDSLFEPDQRFACLPLLLQDKTELRVGAGQVEESSRIASR